MSTAAPITVGNLPEAYRQEISKGRAYIANITEVEHTRSRTYGNYTIAGKRPGEEFSLTEIIPRRGTMDYGDKHVIDFPIMPEEIAADLVREINADAGENSFLGVFVCGAGGPTQKELAQAHARLESFYQTCVAVGDQEWQRSGQIIMIPDLHKRAVVHLKLDREWCSAIQPNLECGACGQKLKRGVAICSGCGAIQDEEKARKFFPERFAPAIAPAEHVLQNTVHEPTAIPASAGKKDKSKL